MQRVSLYKKPFITAFVFLILGLFMFFGGITLADSTKDSDFYALMVFGVLFFIVAIVVFAVYGGLEKKFQNVIKNGMLLNYTLEDDVYKNLVGVQAQDIKSNNKVLLFIMLFFCLLMAVLGPLIVEEDGIIISFIAVGLGVFLTVAYLMITHFRVNKLKKGSKQVVLSKSGAYVCGQFHCFNAYGTRIVGAEYIKNANIGYIKIDYQALTLPAPTPYSVFIPLKSEMETMANDIIHNLLN